MKKISNVTLTLAIITVSVTVVALLFVPREPLVAAPGETETKIKKVETDDALGTTVWMTLENAPFPSAGSYYTDNTVIVFVPHYFSEARNKRTVDMAVYFHGHVSSADRSIKSAELREQLVTSERNAVLIVPQGPKFARDSSGGKLEKNNGLKDLLTEVLDVLQNESLEPTLGNAFLPQKSSGKSRKIGEVVLMAHSGGFQVAARSVKKGNVNVSEVYLFDALYGGLKIFRNWLNHHFDKETTKPHKLVSMYSDPVVTSNHTRFSRMLSDTGIGYVHSSGPRPFSYVVLEIDEYERKRNEAGISEAVFVRAKSHYESIAWMKYALQGSLALKVSKK